MYKYTVPQILFPTQSLILCVWNLSTDSKNIRSHLSRNDFLCILILLKELYSYYHLHNVISVRLHIRKNAGNILSCSEPLMSGKYQGFFFV